MDSIPLTNFIAEFHQLLDALFVGMVLLSVLEADRVQYQMTVDMLPVDMSCHYNFVFVEGFLRELHCNFVCEFGFNFGIVKKCAVREYPKS